MSYEKRYGVSKPEKILEVTDVYERTVSKALKSDNERVDDEISNIISFGKKSRRKK